MKSYFLKHKSLLIISIIFIILSAITDVSFAFIIKAVVDVGSEGTVSELTGIMILSILFLTIAFLFSFFRRIAEAKFVKKSLISLKKDAFSSILKRDIKTFNEDNSAKYISTLTNDINIIEQDYFYNLLEIIDNIFIFTISTISIMMINIQITIGVFVIGVLPIVIPILFSKKVSFRKKEYSDNIGKFTTKIKDIFSGFEVIKSFNIENKINHEYDKSNIETEHSKYRFILISSFVDNLSNSSGLLMFLTAIGIGTYFVIQKQLTFGSMIAAVQLMNYVINPLVNISTRINKMKSIKLIEEKILNLISSSKEINKGIEKKSFNEGIVFKEVEFSYTRDKKLLDKISFEIKKGNKYAIVGGSGSGKSTLLKLLLRYYDDFTGQILIDHIDNRKIDIMDLYSLASVIQQNVFMFDDNIKNNISLYQNYSDTDITRAIELSGLKTLVDSLPNGIDSNVGENGCNLSGGEKQRVAIARALIKNTPILVLDEATSALDNETAYNIENSIINLSDLTSLVVTHKLNKDILRKYDKIIAVKEGKVVELGTFDELVKKQGYFYSLYNVIK